MSKIIVTLEYIHEDVEENEAEELVENFTELYKDGWIPDNGQATVRIKSVQVVN